MSSMLSVWTAGNKSGLLEHDEEYVFSYLHDLPVNNAVSLTMPVRLRSWTYRTLHPVFQMNLPEGSLLAAIRNAFAKVTKVHDLTLLRIVGGNQIGRNRFSLPDESSPAYTSSPESLNEILSYPDTATLFAELLTKYAAQSGVSGVQPKVMLAARERATVYVSSYIVKSWGADYPHLGANEYFCMQAAERAGLPVPEFHLSDDGRLFIMKRFDIGEGGKFFGFEDMCVLQGLGTEDKYRGSYERVVKAINDYVSPQNRHQAKQQFFATLLLSAVLRNGDAHLKNFGVLYSDPAAGDARLAPVYDIVTTTAYIANDVPALTLEGRKRWWNRKSLDAFGKTHCGISSSAVTELTEKICDAVNDTKKELRSHIKEHWEFKEIGQRMLKAWDDGLMRREG